MALRTSRKAILTAAAAAFALGAGAPVMAGGGYYYGHGYYGHHGKHHYRGHHRRHHHGGGGKAAAIALGVIGGAIIINELAESRARDQYYRDRYYDTRYPARAAPYYPERDYLPERDYDYGPEDGSLSGDDLDSRLDGGPAPIHVSVDAAYHACTRHARAALANRGFVLAAPAAPETAEDAGGAWKMTATVLAEDRRGGSWSRAMYCEADESRVYLLELI